MEEYSRASSGSDMSDEEYTAHNELVADNLPRPAKRLRSNTLGASSQSSSSSNYPGASDGPSQSESEGEMGPPTGKTMYKSYEADYPKRERMYSENGDSPMDSLVYTPSKGLGGQEPYQTEPPKKTLKGFEHNPKPKVIISEKAQRMMKGMGYSEGKGLGKMGQGRTVPVEASMQKGRTGLGYQNMLGKMPEDITWDPESDYADPHEIPSWMPETADEELSSYILDDWLAEEPKKLIIDDETNFCEPDILRHVLSSKTIFDKLEEEELRKARTRSNPYETIGSVLFLNRAAVKMANMDAVFDFMFTDPKNEKGVQIIDNNTLLYFADVCAGPGGFSEYVLWRKKWRAKGFGFTLRAKNDFKLSDFYAGPPETFTPYYGAQDDGDVTNPKNLESLRDYVIKYTEDLGVHFLMADGGFSVENQENIQEILSKHLYLCQCIAALFLVRTGGHFVVKLFDLFTPFSVGLVYLMYKSFNKVCIHKPRTSRPANSERYLICKWKRASSDVIGRHLARVNQKMWDYNNKGENLDITQLVPLEVMKKDRAFFDYMCNSNNTLGGRQVQALLKIAAFCRDTTLIETRQAEIRSECLQLWKVPSEVRKAPQQMKLDDVITSVMKLLKCRYSYASDLSSFKTNVLNHSPDKIDTVRKLKEKVFSIYDWHFVFVDHNLSSQVGHGSFFVGLGGRNMKVIPPGNWEPGTNTDTVLPRLPALTVVWGETVVEMRKEKKAQRKVKAIHLIDALVIGGESVAHLHYVDRHKQLQLLCSALDNGSSLIRCKRMWGLEEAERVLQDLETRDMKNGMPASVSMLPRQLTDYGSDQPYHAVGGILLLKSTLDPWHCFMSKKRNVKYFYGPDKKNSNYKSLFWADKPLEACLHALESHQNRLLWHWETPSKVLKVDKPPPGYHFNPDSEETILLYSFLTFLRDNMVLRKL